MCHLCLPFCPPPSSLSAAAASSLPLTAILTRPPVSLVRSESPRRGGRMCLSTPAFPFAPLLSSLFDPSVSHYAPRALSSLPPLSSSTASSSISAAPESAHESVEQGFGHNARHVWSGVEQRGLVHRRQDRTLLWQRIPNPVSDSQKWMSKLVNLTGQFKLNRTKMTSCWRSFLRGRMEFLSGQTAGGVSDSIPRTEWDPKSLVDVSSQLEIQPVRSNWSNENPHPKKIF